MAGDLVTWTYIVANRGNVPLTNVTVTDDQIGEVSCPLETLAVDQSMFCTATATAEAGQYANLATVTGTPPTGADVSDNDPSHYFGASPDIAVKKYTNDVDADIPTGPIIRAGDAVTWRYVVTNTGNVVLNNVAVTDDQVGAISCPLTSLAPGQAMVCTAAGIAEIGQYANMATVVGTPPLGPDVTDEDPSHYYGANPALVIKKYTNGEDADLPLGPEIPVGDPVLWTYIVTNTGNVPLEGLTITDSEGVTVVCPLMTTPIGGVVICHGYGIAEAGQYANTGTATATFMGELLTDDDPSHYYGVEPPTPEAADISIIKLTNGVDANTPAEGPHIRVGDTVTWTYLVANTGDVPLSNIVVTDSVAGVVPVLSGGDTNDNDLLDPDEVWTFIATGIATEGAYANVGTVKGTPPDGPDVPNEDPSHYFGDDPSIAITKLTNGQNANTPPGPTVAIGAPVIWTYVVTNTGNVTLVNIEVTDNRGVNVTCPALELAPGASMTCQGDEGVAQPGQYSNVGTVEGTPPTGPDVSDDDPDHYFGADAVIDIEKFTNGDDADQPPGPTVETGADIIWTYVVTNTGNVRLTNVIVNDDRIGAISCPLTALDPGQSMTCTFTGVATRGQYSNRGTVTGTTPDGEQVVDDDPSHYLGSDPTDLPEVEQPDRPFGSFLPQIDRTGGDE
jgi:uncharacterized repeat protein (TIGR01451 family)